MFHECAKRCAIERTVSDFFFHSTLYSVRRTHAAVCVLATLQHCIFMLDVTLIL